ncbi:hypothetical protein GAYE_SCF78G7093 [Galdieria yellowstonensis]|uniref:Uncharacterized protein n=1 Tax=Galdieria yellowstonensis TaxID=3028027 RepID=A0AAV9ILS3_9RHOD|nr:hypothetical protein GAYE_SCF54G6185 [Galdieria yellowstonensis]KAK4529141.1 hypothetical protein GAYE_SCF78G7093 [Galdieria yellowstonensis]
MSVLVLAETEGANYCFNSLWRFPLLTAFCEIPTFRGTINGQGRLCREVVKKFLWIRIIIEYIECFRFSKRKNALLGPGERLGYSVSAVQLVRHGLGR